MVRAATKTDRSQRTIEPSLQHAERTLRRSPHGLVRVVQRPAHGVRVLCLASHAEDADSCDAHSGNLVLGRGIYPDVEEGAGRPHARPVTGRLVEPLG